MDMTARSAQQIIEMVRENIERILIGKRETVDLALMTLACGGHLLIEDAPGLGKTTLATALARSVDCSFSRIQFTPDVLPSDVTGYTMLDIKTGEKEVRHGVIMSQMVLADEINRTSPKTQSSLLEAMQEGQVTIDGETYPLPKPFMVIATQNPVEATGTYPLPEAQLDRFFMRVSLGYPARSEEIDILQSRKGSSSVEVGAVATAGDVLFLQEQVLKITCARPVMQYIVDIANNTRKSEKLALGASPRGSLALMRAAMAHALFDGRDYVLPDDVKAMAQPVLAHRLIVQLSAGAHKRSAELVLQEILRTTPVPVQS
ncbi:MAG: AAA family ATPase [Acetanaerobacterium sp.]